MEGILTPLALLMPAFSLPAAPRLAHAPASAATGTLSYRSEHPQIAESTASEVGLSPVELSAPEHLTSELLRTLSRMAASKPTSWLSVHSDIVSHLANTWGP